MLNNKMQIKEYHFEDTRKMHGVKRVLVFCILIVILPATLIIIPLYLRKTVFADVTYPVAESDIIEIRDGISSIFCQQHSLRMNTNFNAFQLQSKPEISTNRKHIRLKKSMTLPDDTLEYWGFFLLKGAKVHLKFCSRYDGSRILVVKGQRDLKTCGLLDHNKNKLGANYAQGHDQVKVFFEDITEMAENVPADELMERRANGTKHDNFMDEENHGGEDLTDDGDSSEVAKALGIALNSSIADAPAIRATKLPRKKLKKGSLNSLRHRKVEEQNIRGNSSKVQKIDVDAENTTASTYTSQTNSEERPIVPISKKQKRHADLLHVGEAVSDKRHEAKLGVIRAVEDLEPAENIATAKTVEPTENIEPAKKITPAKNIAPAEHVAASKNIASAEHLAPSGTIATAAKNIAPTENITPPEVPSQISSTPMSQMEKQKRYSHQKHKAAKQKVYDQLFKRRSKREQIYDRKYSHGGNAVNFTETDESNSISSFETGLFDCFNGAILLAEGFPPSAECLNAHFLENGSQRMLSKHEITEDGYYYYIFYSDNDLVRNDIHAIFDIYKPTFQYSNQSDSQGCIDTTNCTFTIGFLSDEIVVVEVPTRDGIEHEADDITYLISTCHPRTEIYAIFPITVLILILSCSFL